MARKRKPKQPVIHGTPMPGRVAARWQDIPGAPKSGSVEERANQLIDILTNKPKRKKGDPPAKLLNALALDLISVCCIENFGLPDEVAHLMALVLDLKELTEIDGVVEGYSPYEWDHRWLEGRGKRGRPAREVQEAKEEAYNIDYDHAVRVYAGEELKRLEISELQKELDNAGYGRYTEDEIKRTTLSTWRRQNYGFPTRANRDKYVDDELKALRRSMEQELKDTRSDKPEDAARLIEQKLEDAKAALIEKFCEEISDRTFWPPVDNEGHYRWPDQKPETAIFRTEPPRRKPEPRR